MTAIPYLSFDGTCREAFEFYRDLLGGDLQIFTFGDSPEAGDMPGDENRVMNAQLESGNLRLMGGDTPNGHYTKPQGFSINIEVDSADDGARIFDALADGGKVIMPFEQTFWVERFGMTIDRFGTPWMVNAGKPASIPES